MTHVSRLLGASESDAKHLDSLIREQSPDAPELTSDRLSRLLSGRYTRVLQARTERNNLLGLITITLSPRLIPDQAWITEMLFTPVPASDVRMRHVAFTLLLGAVLDAQNRGITKLDFAADVVPSWALPLAAKLG